MDPWEAFGAGDGGGKSSDDSDELHNNHDDDDDDGTGCHPPTTATGRMDAIMKDAGRTIMDPIQRRLQHEAHAMAVFLAQNSPSHLHLTVSQLRVGIYCYTNCFNNDPIREDGTSNEIIHEDSAKPDRRLGNANGSCAPSTDNFMPCLVSSLQSHGLNCEEITSESICNGSDLLDEYYDTILLVWHDQIQKHAASGVDITSQRSSVDRILNGIESYLTPGGFLMIIHVESGQGTQTISTQQEGYQRHVDDVPAVPSQHQKDASSSLSNWMDTCNFTLDPTAWNLNTQVALSSPTIQGSARLLHGFHCEMFAITKWPCRIQDETCCWLPNKYDGHAERCRLAQAVVTVSAKEYQEQRRRQLQKREDNGLIHLSNEPFLRPAAIQKAVMALQIHGYCVIKGLLRHQRNVCEQFAAVVQRDLHAAADILLQPPHKVDILNPVVQRPISNTSNNKDSINGNVYQEPATYREISMREDLRVDLRDGPALRDLRGRRQSTAAQHDRVEVDDNATCIITSQQSSLPSSFLRGQGDILHIVRTVMNPTSVYSRGNIGRYNFSGTGPDGSFQNLRASAVGGIISLPGAADQALHADTPHLFEHEGCTCLPAHYINVFTPGTAPVSGVGQTSFIQGSHRLDWTASHYENRADLWKNLVRPRLEIGDVLLFDCRILHFGLSNVSTFVERVVLYSNLTMHWFNDPKNWDNERSIFQSMP